MLRIIIYTFLTIIVGSTYNTVIDNKYKQYNREIIYNKWEPIQEKPVVYYLRGSKQNISI